MSCDIIRSGEELILQVFPLYHFLSQNLSLADLLMGIYLIVLATHDLRYRGSYLSKDKEWRDSWGCDVIGILATVSNEASVLTLTMITLDRYILLLFCRLQWMSVCLSVCLSICLCVCVFV